MYIKGPLHWTNLIVYRLCMSSQSPRLVIFVYREYCTGAKNI